MTVHIPVAAPNIGSLEEEYALDAIRSSWISSTGPYVDRFEREFAELCGVNSVVSVSSGTTALHTALLALGAGPGDEVIVPSLTYIAAVNAIHYVGATPVFVDVEESTWCLDPGRVKSAITPRTKGIVAVHLYGHPADMDSLTTLAKQAGIWIVEDAAEAHFASYKGRPVGGLGTIGVFSFYGNKIVTSGEGGAITVNDELLEKRIRQIRGQGMDPERRYYFPIVGYNYRLTNVACAILCAQLKRKKEIEAARSQIYGWYDEALSGIDGVGLQPSAPWAKCAKWLYCVTIDQLRFGACRDEVAGALAKNGIETRPFFIPVHTLPPYRLFAKDGDLPVTERLAQAGLNLPTFSTLTKQNINQISRVLHDCYKG